MSNTIEAQFRCQRANFMLDITVSIPGRGITGIFGDSGSGKTTFLRCLAGLERAQAGNLQVNGLDWQNDDKGVFIPCHQRAIGFVFQQPNLFAHLSVQKNLDYGQKRKPGTREILPPDTIISLLALEHLLHRMPAQLSSGETQRVAIARALLTQPELLLLDEPLTALDRKRKAELIPLLEQLHEQWNLPIIYVSHSVAELARLADHMLVLDEGRVVAAGGATEVISEIKKTYADYNF